MTKEKSEEITFRVHWLSFTVHAATQDAFTLYNIFFRDIFGDLEDVGHGGRGFKNLLRGFLQLKLYLNPIRKDSDYFHFEIPGKACDFIHWEYFKALEQYLDSNYKKYKYKRLDFAFDNVPFTPQQVEQAINEDKIRSLAKRETLRFHGSPFQERDNGELGTYTIELGSNTSQRMMTVYNKRGPTRLEFQTKDKRSHIVTKELFGANDINEWQDIMLGHLRDYVDFETSWWDEFTQGTARAWLTLSNPKEVSMEKLANWLNYQVAPGLSTYIDTQPPEVIERLLEHGRNRRNPKYNLLLGG